MKNLIKWLRNSLTGHILALLSAGWLSLCSISLFQSTLFLTSSYKISIWNLINGLSLLAIYLFCWAFIDIFLKIHRRNLK